MKGAGRKWKTERLDELKETLEEAIIIFKDVESLRIITAMATNSSDELSIKFDFGDEGANSHDGLYATLFMMFAESLKNK